MLSKLKLVLGLLDTKTKTKLLIYSFFRMIIGVVDIIGVLLIGLLLSKSVNSVVTNSNSDSKLSNYLGYFDRYSIIQIALIATTAFIAKSILSAFLTKIMLDDFTKIEVGLANKSFNYMLSNISWTIKTYSKSDINFLLKSSVSSTVQMVSAYVVVISEFFFLLAMFISFLFIDPEITLFIVAYFTIIATFLHNFLGKRFKAAGIRSVTNEVAATTVIFDTIQSYREVISLKREKYFLDKFKDHKFNVAKASFDIQFLSSLPRYVVESSLLLGTLGIISLSLRSGNIQQSAETIGIFITGSLKIMTSLLPLQTYFAQFKNQLEISQKFLDFSEIRLRHAYEFSEILPEKQISNVSSPVGVKVEKLSFQYSTDADFVLDGIDLTIDPGQFVAVIGSSGSGKSTLADLIIGVNKPTSGSISFITNQGRSVSLNDFNLGYVPQVPARLYGTIKENIAFGIDSDQINTKFLEESIEAAQLGEVISTLKLGFETHTGEQSDDLSGGQMQRIGLARALYGKPNLLILDEATSALDVESEAAVSQSLEKLKGKCTVIIIAHRLSTVKNADTVFVMDSGKIVAAGKFSELAKANETVARLVELSDLNIN